MATLPPPAPRASHSPLPPPSIPQAGDGQPQARSGTAASNGSGGAGRAGGQEIGGGKPHHAKNKVINRCKESSLGHTITKAREMLELLVHAYSCRTLSCQYTNCRRLKGMFGHAMKCTKQGSGGCKVCLKLWSLLHLHARACKDSECSIPRCRALKDMIRRSHQQAETRRRAAVNEMMRQRAAEAARR